VKYVIHALKNGECNVRDYLTYGNTDSPATSRYNLYVWLIQGGERPIIIDPGIRDIESFNRMTEEYIPGGVRQKSEERTAELLRNLKIDPKDVPCVIVTHLHPDHYERYDLFINARLVVNRKGFLQNLLNIKKDVMKALVANWPNSLHLAKDEEEILPGIRVFWVGGHSICSQAIAIETNLGRAVITGDVVFKYRNIEENIPIGLPYSTEQCIAAMERIRREADIVLPGHDPEILKRYPRGIIG